jgi:hypothetical protein
MRPFAYYFRQANHFFYIQEREQAWQHLFKPFEKRVLIDKDPEPVLAKYKSFWLVNLKNGIFINGARILEEKGWQEIIPTKGYSLSDSWFGVMVSKFTLTTKAEEQKK